jgi:hypothetical protein
MPNVPGKKIVRIGIFTVGPTTEFRYQGQFRWSWISPALPSYNGFLPPAVNCVVLGNAFLDTALRTTCQMSAPKRFETLCHFLYFNVQRERPNELAEDEEAEQVSDCQTQWRFLGQLSQVTTFFRFSHPEILGNLETANINW